ncbi:AAA family ATPase [Mesorhizobium sp. VK25A]|uniref:AAA family ATPase n=1 Tax=Mesorhizobium vachelliae TaxID=3072309 RepID=A0ABU5A9G7_9HYPH|nr:MULTISPECIES: AAA family ATPase [unclassified Mesorhizobium]MDX8533827.1 AAA family ATPase [Mesorhizobium sp. VK25D]MDX8546422.1 AAA family ATPase [Mesorhizobium sp. VK25A]
MLLERQPQLQQMDALLADATGGRGRVVVVSGEAGAGKTALVEAFASRLDGSLTVLRSACEDLSIPDPLGPLYDLARNGQWELPRVIGDREVQRLPLFSEALDVLEAKGPCLLVIEDLHWADDATLDFVRFLGRRIANTRILLLITARTDRSEGQMRVRRALGEIPAGNVMRIDVPLLSESAVLSLAEAAERDGGAIYRASAGNAFFVTELLAAEGSGALPASVRDAVLARAEKLSPGARSMLDAVSVFPRRADSWALSGLCGIAAAGQLAECVAHGLLEDFGDGYAFRHEIARTAIEMALTPSKRREYNERALAALRDNPQVATARLVHHAVEAQNLDVVRELAPVAAREASRVGAHRDAAGYYELRRYPADRDAGGALRRPCLRVPPDRPRRCGDGGAGQGAPAAPGAGRPAQGRRQPQVPVALRLSARRSRVGGPFRRAGRGAPRDRPRQCRAGDGLFEPLATGDARRAAR